ncbi:MAG: NADH-quinone oxidoreductase subunit C [Ignavibacteria bacterium]
MEFKELIVEKIRSAFNGALSGVNEYRGDLSLTVDSGKIAAICKFLKEDSELNFNMCEDVTAIDQATHTNRFTLVYHIYSLENKFRLRLKTNIEAEMTDTVTGIWQSANWYEREVFDMYGIKFHNHPDLRRIYMPEEFEYHPLRKEFPVLGIPGSIPLPKK